MKELRLRIDELMNSFSLLHSSREVSLAFTNAQRAKMFLGMVLKYTEGNPNPYPESTNTKNTVIEKMADKAIKTFADMDSWKLLIVTNTNTDPTDLQTLKVKFFRNELDSIELQLSSISLNMLSPLAEKWHWQSYFALVECKLWLGMELNRIFELKK
jgi:hypothetical protein